MKQLTAVALLPLIFLSGGVAAKDLKVTINKISEAGSGEKIGDVSISESGKGVAFKVAVKGIPEGEHGFHVHEKGDCGPAMKDGKMTAGGAAGDHYDPNATHSHQGPEGAGHEGDAPKLNATADGIDQTVEAPRLQLSDIEGRTLMIHEGGDNYSNNPENGGGKGRIACGVIPKS
jgi:superoxide dismutase, Cu-Zn family